MNDTQPVASPDAEFLRARAWPLARFCGCAIAGIVMVGSMAAAARPVGGQAAPTWRLVEEWRVGGEVAGPHSFSKVVAMRVLADGRVVVLEGKDQQVHLLGAQGEPIKTVGRAGAGPGEFREANGLLIAPNGEIVVQDVANARLTFVSPDGNVLRTVQHQTWGATDTWDAYYNADKRLVEYNGNLRRVWSADYTAADTLTTTNCANIPIASDEAQYFRVQTDERSAWQSSYPFVIARRGARTTSDGFKWIAELPDYRMIRRIRFGSCDVVATVSLSGALIDIPTVLYNKTRDGFARLGAGQTGPRAPDPNKIRRALPAFESLTMDAANRLWVERLVPGKVTFDSSTLWPKGPRRFEIFAASGTQIAALDAPLRAKLPREYGIIAITAERFYAFVLDDDEIPFLTAYRIAK